MSSWGVPTRDDVPSLILRSQVRDVYRGSARRVRGTRKKDGNDLRVVDVF